MIYFCEWKLKNVFGAAFPFLYLHPFWSLSCDISIQGGSSLSQSLSRDFSIYGTSFFFGRFVQKVLVSWCSDSFVQKTTQQSDGSCDVTSNSQFFYKLFKNSLFISANAYEKNIVIKEYFISRLDDKLCFLPNCRYHIILIGNIEELLQKSDAFCVNYQHVDCLYALFKYRSSGKIVVKSVQLFDNLQSAVHFNQQNRELDRMPSIAKKRLLRKKYKKYLLSSFQKTKSTQTSGSVFADRIEPSKTTKFELELKEIVDCFLNGDGNYTSNLVSFKIKLYKLIIF